MLDSFLSEYGVIVLMAVFAIIGLWPVWLVMGITLLVWSMLRGEE